MRDIQTCVKKKMNLFFFLEGLLMPLLTGQWRETGNRAERRGMTHSKGRPDSNRSQLQ